MAKSVLTILIVAIATLQLAFATNRYCKPPKNISNGGFKPYDDKYPVGSRVSFYCADNFELYGSSSAKCIHSKYYKIAFWSHKPPVCRLKCPKLDDPKFGKVKLTGRKPGDKAFHFCDRGFELKGDKTRICQKDGYWSGKAPKCIKIPRCPKLRLDYGFVKHTGFKPGNIATHFCKRCFKLVGGKVRKCQRNGKWSGEPPVCKKIDCGKPPAPDYGSVSFRSTTCRSKAFHSCGKGHDLRGNKVRVCQSNGFWSGKTPICQPRKY